MELIFISEPQFVYILINFISPLLSSWRGEIKFRWSLSWNIFNITNLKLSDFNFSWHLPRLGMVMICQFLCYFLGHNPKWLWPFLKLLFVCDLSSHAKTKKKTIYIFLVYKIIWKCSSLIDLNDNLFKNMTFVKNFNEFFALWPNYM